MPFPFFRLPFELRYIIYQYLFTPEYRDSFIAPDVGHICCTLMLHPPDTGQWPAFIGLKCQALPLMQTCQQAHDESTSVLYGDNTFRFDYVPYDDFWDFYPFLSVIGRENRMKLRHLDLRFNTCTTFAGTPFAVREVDTVWDTKHKSDPTMTSSTCNALDFLSERHRLQSLVLRFQGSYWGAARFSFCFSKDSEVYRSLTQFKAISKLKCCVDMDGLYEIDDAKYAVYEKAVNNYHELRAELAAAYALESQRIASSSTENGLQSEPIPQFGASS